MEILYWNWTETQHNLHNLKVWSFSAAVAAFATVVVQYAVSEWIWFGDGGSKRRPHKAPVYLISSCIFFFLWSTIFNRFMGHIPLGYIIATPIVAFGGVLLNLAFCWIWTTVFPDATHSEDEEDDKSNKAEEKALDQDTEAPPSNTGVVTKPPPKNKPNVMYMTNIKIFLTAMVLVFHCATAITLQEHSTVLIPDNWMSINSIGTWVTSGFFYLQLFTTFNQCYFMYLFFFISGYFVPRSFDKKGMRTFLMGRARRLGIPLVLLAYFLSWARFALERAVFNLADAYNDPLIWSPAQGWFLMMLMIYGIAYAFLCGKGWSPKVSCPSILGFFVTSIVLGLVGFVLALCFPLDNPPVMDVPLSPAALPLQIIFFFYGAVAQRNDWMQEIQSKSRIVIYLWAILSLIGMAACITVNYAGNPILTAVVQGFCMCGYMAIPISLAVTIFFMDLFNKKYFFTDFFAQSMYTTYIIQRFPIVIGLRLWVLVLEASDNVIAVSEPNNIVMPGNMVIPAFLFMTAFAMIVTWPLAYAIRSIPGFSKVL